jgi:sugar lactone lactonase YvrE
MKFSNPLSEKIFAAAISCALGAANLQAAEPVTHWNTSGFREPESVFFDAAKRRLIVSNINGSAVTEDGNGFLSLLRTNGKVIKRKWIGGFDAPTGMAGKGGKLYVADIRRIRIVDIVKETVVKSIPIGGAGYLNDVAIGPDGAVYVTDVVNDSIYRIEDDQAEIWIQDPALGHPNGIVNDGHGRFIVASWGKEMKPDFSTRIPGSLIAIDFASKRISMLSGASEVGNLDGVAFSDQQIYFTDNPSGRLLRLDQAGVLSVVTQLPPSAADFSIGDGTAFVPQISKGRVTALKLPK